jgi:hypothetical protein
MGFEKVVLDKVAKAIKEDRKASFTCGTLFVECNEGQARSVFHMLSKYLGVGRVQVSGPVTGEYAFDFVAQKQQEEHSPFATVNS